jgi:hypothetical protein
MKNNIEDKQISSINTSRPEIISQTKYTDNMALNYHFRFMDCWPLFCKLCSIIH